MTKPHIITVEDLQEMYDTHEVLMAGSNGKDSKSLKCSLNGTLRVRKGNEVVYIGMQLARAVEAYNDLY